VAQAWLIIGPLILSLPINAQNQGEQWNQLAG
jgi:hypothetical protein